MLLDWLVPPLCIACRHATCARRGDPLCAPCRTTLPWLGPRVCPRCAQPRPCGRCPAARHAFARAWAPLGYAGPVPAVVNALKERGALGLAGLMAAQLVATAPPDLWPAPDDGGAALVPVPGDPWRRRRRGIDHTARLARALAPRTGLPVAPILARSARRPRQAGRRRAQRLRADPADVQVRTGRGGPDGPVGVAVLVDDVHTTGATLHACALALKDSGVRRVVAVTYARALA
ncbi:MAG TPA: double zinc ribbon domain-containing protein [Baekduia sp.]|uniref:ComF family protein n=1 Tax=Baekduia sp. TaxID=2600305 RepID=UPI002D7807C3|nr:double zinc ribbon domain-containing protein [Baekduia sp.]HET6506724.1 double zinc ribbon domain-containing protein [Baekduia sp.]